MDPSLTDRWLAALHDEGKSRHTLTAYRRALQHFQRWNEASYGTAELDPAAVLPRDVREWQAYQQTAEKARPTTINQRLVALGRFFAWAVATGHATRNPTDVVRGLRLGPRHPQALSAQQVRGLLRAVHREEEARDIAIVELLLGSGLRVSELLALQVGDVVVRPRSGWVTVRRGKGGTFREVPLPAEVRRALERYLAEHPRRDELAAPLWQGERGALQSRSAITRLLEKYALRAQLEPFGPHVLRHTYATRYLEANPDDLRGLAALLGHSSLDTVMRYTEPTTAALAERVERLG